MSVALLARRRVGYATFAFACVGFVSLGLPDGLLGVAWPTMSAAFDVDLSALGQLFVATTIGYCIASVAAARLLSLIGIGLLLVASCAATALSLVGYAMAPGWALLLMCGVVAGAGGGAIDAGLNAHAAHHFSVRAVNLLHACYGVGTAAGPLIMTSILVAQRPWVLGYLIVAIAQLMLACAFMHARNRWSSPRYQDTPATNVPMLETVRRRDVRWSLLLFLLYVGAEAGAGAWIFSFLSMQRDFSVASAGLLVSVYWAGLFAGRTAIALTPVTPGAGTILRLCTMGAVTGVTMLTLFQAFAPTCAAVALLGAASGPMFPTLIASTTARHGADHTANAVSLQVAASALGLAAVPALLGALSATLGLNTLPHLLLIVWGLIALTLSRTVVVRRDA